MRYQVEFSREVVTRDGYETEIEAAGPAEADQAAERMAIEMDRDCPDGVAETGPVECQSWSVSAVKPMPDADRAGGIRVPANDVAAGDPTSILSLPRDVWEGMLRAVQIGVPQLGLEDRAAVAAFTALKLHVHLESTRMAASG